MTDPKQPPKPELQNGLLFRRIADGSAGLLFGYTVNPGNAQTMLLGNTVVGMIESVSGDGE